jgi:hypothetical protein
MNALAGPADQVTDQIADGRDDDYQGGRPRFPWPVVARRYAATGTGTARKATVDKGKASSGTSALATPPGKGKD